MALARLRLRLLFTPQQWLRQTSDAAIAALDWTGRTVEALSWQAASSAIRAIRWRHVVLVASAPFVLPAEWRAALVRILAYLAAIGLLSVLAAQLVKQPETVAVLDYPARPAWIEIDRPWPAFQLALPGFADDTHYAIRRHAEGGGRKDTLSFGELGKTQRYMSVEIYRAGREAASFAGPSEEIRALASEHGRVLGLRGSMPIPSKFGPLTTYEFAIGPFGGYHCVGFLRAFTSPQVQISGLSCNMKLVVDRSAISCALDRLSLVSAGSDPDIAKLFAQAELKRDFCGRRDPLLYATPRRGGGDVVTNSVKLRGRIAR